MSADAKPTPKLRISRSGRKRIDVPDLIAQLEADVEKRRQHLEQETQRNLVHKRRLALLTGVSCASAALRQLLQADPSDPSSLAAAAAAAKSTLDALEAESRALVCTLQGGGGSRDAARGGQPCSSMQRACSSSSSAGEVSARYIGDNSSPAPQLPQQEDLQKVQQERQQEQEMETEPQEGAGDPSSSAADPGAPECYNSVSLGPGAFIDRLMAMHDYTTTKAAFADDWRIKTRDLAVLLHQHSRGAPVMDQLRSHVQSMALLMSALLLFQPNVGYPLLSTDLETGVTGEPDQGMWDRTVASMNLNDDQASTLSILNQFWQSTSKALNEERQTLAQRALGSPHDLELQEEIVAGLEHVNRGFLIMAVGVKIIMITSLMNTQQLAEVYVQCWPRLPILLGILAGIHRNHMLRKQPQP